MSRLHPLNGVMKRRTARPFVKAHTPMPEPDAPSRHGPPPTHPEPDGPELPTGPYAPEAPGFPGFPGFPGAPVVDDPALPGQDLPRTDPYPPRHGRLNRQALRAA